MNTISVAQAEGQSSALIDLVEAGETVSLTRRGKEVARLTPAEKAFRALADSMPMFDEDGGDFIRKTRDDARYRWSYVDTSVLVAALTREPATGRVMVGLGQHPAWCLLTNDGVVTEFSATFGVNVRMALLDVRYRDRPLADFQRISAIFLSFPVTSDTSGRQRARPIKMTLAYERPTPCIWPLPPIQAPRSTRRVAAAASALRASTAALCIRGQRPIRSRVADSGAPTPAPPPAAPPPASPQLSQR
jgi:prevent-host-death family protein